jgi:hypothetical protein
MKHTKIKSILTKEFLIENYINKNLSSHQISLIVGCTNPTINNYLEWFNIPKRKFWGTRKSKKKYWMLYLDSILTREFFIKNYTNKKMSFSQISRMINCNRNIISDYFKKFNISKNPLFNKEKYYQANKEKISRKNKIIYKNNKKKFGLYQIQYRLKNKKEINEHRKERKKIDINFRLSDNLRIRLSNAITRGQKAGSAIRDLGCSVDYFKKYLESKFSTGMSWDNYGWGENKWNIDHIHPLSKTDLTNRIELLKVCHYTNLQPMWHNENMKKGNKI